MKFSRVTTALVMASLAAPAFAGAELSVGTVASASQGTYVAREGRLVPAYAGQTLFAGDRVVTRNGANARVAFQGCNMAVGSTSILSVGKSGCAATPKTLAAKRAGFTAMGDDDAAGGSGGSSTGYIVGGLALLAIAGGVIAATSHTSTTPTSP